MALTLLGLAPLLAALIVPAALAWRDAADGGTETASRSWRARLWPGLPGVAAALLAGGAAAAAVPSDAPAGLTVGGAAASATALVGAFGLLAAALYATARAAGAAPAGGQALAAVVAILLLAAPFYMDPVIEGAEPAARGFWVGTVAGASPTLVLVHAAAGIDPLRAPLLYDLSVCQYYAYAYPSPWTLAGAYVALSGLLMGAGLALRRLRPGPGFPVPGFTSASRLPS